MTSFINNSTNTAYTRSFPISFRKNEGTRTRKYRFSKSKWNDINEDHHHHIEGIDLVDKDTGYQRIVYTEEPEHYKRKLPRMRSRTDLRYHTRSTSRASHHHNQYYAGEELERRPASHLSRRNSSASVRLDPSSSATLVSNPMTPRARGNKTRSKSIESGNWG